LPDALPGVSFAPEPVRAAGRLGPEFPQKLNIGSNFALWGQVAAILFTFGEAFLPDAHLDDARLIHTGDAHIFKYAIINFALPRPLDNDFLSAGYERPKFGRLWLLGRIGAEGEVDSSVGQVRMTGGIGDLKFLNCWIVRNTLQNGVKLCWLHTGFFGLRYQVRGK
jgi:hypothetical protein